MTVLAVADAATAAVYYGGALILFVAFMAVVEGILHRRDRRQARQWKREMRGTSRVNLDGLPGYHQPPGAAAGDKHRIAA